MREIYMKLSIVGYFSIHNNFSERSSISDTVYYTYLDVIDLISKLYPSYYHYSYS